MIYKSCREEILSTVKEILNEKGKDDFTIIEVLEAMNRNNTTYSEYTIRTHISSRCCSNAPNHHKIVFHDYYRIERGKYRLL
ncbi:DUF7669 domain-containing protein [Sutcliffiella horikoshii]|uniref:DUF7669 domain-containing protein n=1 Tax=Sutcliffiella horikoshii TaxID=79883 RepID=UPI003CF0471B